jgi:hypothetical protein
MRRHKGSSSLIGMIVTLVILLGISVSNAHASVIAIGAGAFGPGSTLTTFTGIPDGTDVNGLNVGGILFSYSLGNGNLVIDGGPGTTTNIQPPNIVSIGNPAGVLTLTLPGLVGSFGYGYALLSTAPITNATTIALFQGATAVGGLSYNGIGDPSFTGGFAGIQSTIPFDRVQVTFNAVAAPAFAMDNIRTAAATAAVPELPSIGLILMALAPLVLFGSISSYKAAKVNRI